ncbi:MAG TPA: hypothetical protein VIL74_13485 [Pyrinomonadaceae bacterium]|jgi:hypothetical protein
MPESVKLVKAELQEIDLAKPEAAPKKKVPVQFNPETLKVSFANQIQTPEGGSGDQRGGAARQFVGAGTTKLALQLWFDVNAAQEGEKADDVRKMTEKVTYFITPAPDKKDKKKFIPPGVRFIWGSFQFDGVMESLEESLEFFSSEGIPLRASMTLNLTQQKIDTYKFPAKAPAGKPLPGTRPLTPVAKSATAQSLAASAGKGDDWQSVAAANGIENPRRLQAGMLLDMDAQIGVSGGVPLVGGAGATANISARRAFETE